MRSIVFEGNTWNKYKELRKTNKTLHKNLCIILKEMQRDNPKVGTGKPEPLRHGLKGLWSRRLSLKDRLIYSFDKKPLFIYAIGGHYDKY